MKKFKPFDDADSMSWAEMAEATALLARTLQNMAGVQTDAGAPIQNLHPHYTNSYFSEARTVYLASGHELDGATYNYSDRIRQWDWDKADAAWTAVRGEDKRMNTANEHEAYLRLVFDKPNLKLVHIMAGFNVSNGYPYQVYGYIEGD